MGRCITVLWHKMFILIRTTPPFAPIGRLT